MAKRRPLSPPPNAEGLYSCLVPFELAAGVIYKCEAIRTFPELERRGTPVYETYYKPRNLSVQEYKDDADVGASIVVLKASDGEVRYIPNTFITSIPGSSGMAYKRGVMVIDLAFLPDYIDANIIKADTVDLFKRNLGIEVLPFITTMRYEGTVTEEMHQEMEVKRKALIRQYTPLSEQLAESEQRNVELKDLNDKLMTTLNQLQNG